MDRRMFLSTGSVAALSLPLLTTPAAARVPAAGKTKANASGDAKLNALFERIFQDRV